MCSLQNSLYTPTPPPKKGQASSLNVHAYLSCKDAFSNPLVLLFSLFYGFTPPSILQGDSDLDGQAELSENFATRWAQQWGKRVQWTILSMDTPEQAAGLYSCNKGADLPCTLCMLREWRPFWETQMARLILLGLRVADMAFAAPTWEGNATWRHHYY